MATSTVWCVARSNTKIFTMGFFAPATGYRCRLDGVPRVLWIGNSIGRDRPLIELEIRQLVSIRRPEERLGLTHLFWIYPIGTPRHERVAPAGRETGFRAGGGVHDIQVVATDVRDLCVVGREGPVDQLAPPKVPHQCIGSHGDCCLRP